MSRPASSARIFATALLALAALGACASTHNGPSNATAASPDEQAQVEEARRSLLGSERELGMAGQGPAPECHRACDLAANICELATRICGITARFASTDPIDAHCEDAHRRCDRDFGLTNVRCGCNNAR